MSAHCLKSGVLSKLPFLPEPINFQKLILGFHQSGNRKTAIDKIPAHASHLGYRTIVSAVIIFENTCFSVDNDGGLQNNGNSILSD